MVGFGLDLPACVIFLLFEQHWGGLSSVDRRLNRVLGIVCLAEGASCWSVYPSNIRFGGPNDWVQSNAVVCGKIISQNDLRRPTQNITAVNDRLWHR